LALSASLCLVVAIGTQSTARSIGYGSRHPLYDKCDTNDPSRHLRSTRGYLPVEGSKFEHRDDLILTPGQSLAEVCLGRNRQPGRQGRCKAISMACQTACDVAGRANVRGGARVARIPALMKNATLSFAPSTRYCGICWPVRKQTCVWRRSALNSRRIEADRVGNVCAD
jgi:hypothetical protein